MAVYDTEENNRTWMTEVTLKSFAETVNWSRHRLMISDNGSCDETHDLYDRARDWLPFEILYNGKNIGTANAINRVWQYRQPGEHAVKADNDVRILQPEWADWMEDAFSRDPKLGILGLKRRDLSENPFDGSSELMMLPHEKGQRWIVIEKVNHVIGTCQAYSSPGLDSIGYLYQPGVYGFDDSLSAVRARVAGFYSAFLCGFEIDHLDPGGCDFSRWKVKEANKHWDAYNVLAVEYEMGIRNVRYDPFVEAE